MKFIKLLAIMFILTLAGCKTTEPLYYYGGYTDTLYGHFKGNEVSASEQIAVLEQAIETAAGKGKPIAPGVHAHLGMLYYETGSSAQGANHFETEKALFPESSAYLDFLMKNNKAAQ